MGIVLPVETIFEVPSNATVVSFANGKSEEIDVTDARVVRLMKIEKQVWHRKSTGELKFGIYDLDAILVIAMELLVNP